MNYMDVSTYIVDNIYHKLRVKATFSECRKCFRPSLFIGLSIYQIFMKRSQLTRNVDMNFKNMRIFLYLWELGWFWN